MTTSSQQRGPAQLCTHDQHGEDLAPLPAGPLGVAEATCPCSCPPRPTVAVPTLGWKPGCEGQGVRAAVSAKIGTCPQVPVRTRQLPQQL